jgi:hypothetical protein
MKDIMCSKRPDQAGREVVLEAARGAGANVRRGVSVRKVKPGETPVVVYADDRSSMGRTLALIGAARNHMPTTASAVPTCPVMRSSESDSSTRSEAVLTFRGKPTTSAIEHRGRCRI